MFVTVNIAQEYCSGEILPSVEFKRDPYETYEVHARRADALQLESLNTAGD